MTTNTPIIVLLAEENTSPSVLYGIYDVLYSVGTVFPDMTIGEPGTELMDVRIVSRAGVPFKCFGNVPIEPHGAIADIAQADAIVVCDMYSPIHTAPIGQYPEISDWLRLHHKRGTLITSVCSGTIVLAEAGLLNGHEATVHWAYGEMFAKSYPAVKMQMNSILCLSAEDDGIVTAGGVTSWQDLSLYLVARFCGRQKAAETAKVFLLSGHEDGQLPFAAMNRQLSNDDPVISDCQQWLGENYMSHNPVQVMAGRAHLNPRTFARRFRSATGRSPIDYVQTLRIEEAKQMLETEDVPIDDIGQAIGYSDPSSFRRVFARKAGISPGKYRRKFAGIGGGIG